MLKFCWGELSDKINIKGELEKMWVDGVKVFDSEEEIAEPESGSGVESSA